MFTKQNDEYYYKEFFWERDICALVIRKISICSRCICNISTVSGLLLQLLLKMCLPVGAFFRSLLLFHLVVCILYIICLCIHLHDEYHAPLERVLFGESVRLIASL